MTGERLKEIRARYEKEAAGMDLRDLPRRDVRDLLTEVERLASAVERIESLLHEQCYLTAADVASEALRGSTSCAETEP